MNEIAKKIHNESIVVDAHLDLGGIIYNNRVNGKIKVLNDLFLNDFRKSGIKFVISAIFIENNVVDMSLKLALLQIEAIKADIRECKDFVLIKNSNDMIKSVKENKIGLILSLEGLEPIHRELELLNVFYELGVRGFGVTWARRNYVADGSYFRSPEEGTLGGLTPFGIQVMEKAAEIGYFVDVSHINDIGFDDVFKYVDSAIIASHSNARKLNKISRNLSDNQIRTIASRNGVIGVNAYTSIVSSEDEKQSIKGLCDHIDYLVEISSDRNVGFGFDLCNKYYDNGKKYDILNSHEDTILITEELLKRNYSVKSIKNIIGLNFYNYLLKVLK